MNSGRLLSMIATVSPLPTPSVARPPAIRRDLVAQLAPGDDDLVVALAGDDRRVVGDPLDGLLEGDARGSARTARAPARRSR